MPEPRHWYLFMYDVTEDRRLRKVRKILNCWGEPLQYSIYYARLTKRERERVRYELSEHLTKEDRLAVVRLCNGCASRVKGNRSAGSRERGWRLTSSSGHDAFGDEVEHRPALTP